jgi:glutaredoxin
MKKIIDAVFGRGNFLRITLPIILVIILAVIGWSSFRRPGGNLNTDQAQLKAGTFVNGFLMQAGNKATIKEITEAYGLYKLKIDIVSDVVESYMSKDGKLFFPQALDIDQISGGSANKAAGASNAAPAATVSVKSDKPSIELFVMSYCPYGTQIEKGILPVLSALGQKIDFQLKFVDYAMHGQKELQENLSQYCIQKEQTDKFQDYLKCFLVAGDSASCVSSTGVNKSKMDSCVAKTDNQYKVIANYNNQVGYQGSYPGFDINKPDNTKYSVAGSPTLIINGQEISSGRDSASLLTTICSAFNNQPSECSTVLPATSPAPGFGSGTVASAASATQCAPQ